MDDWADNVPQSDAEKTDRFSMEAVERVGTTVKQPQEDGGRQQDGDENTARAQEPVCCFISRLITNDDSA